MLSSVCIKLSALGGHRSARILSSQFAAVDVCCDAMTADAPSHFRLEYPGGRLYQVRTTALVGLAVKATVLRGCQYGMQCAWQASVAAL